MLDKLPTGVQRDTALLLEAWGRASLTGKPRLARATRRTEVQQDAAGSLRVSLIIPFISYPREWGTRGLTPVPE
jgi:hypothetical protein